MPLFLWDFFFCLFMCFVSGGGSVFCLVSLCCFWFGFFCVVFGFCGFLVLRWVGLRLFGFVDFFV